MLDLPQIGPLAHQRDQLGLGAVGRAVVDVDDLERPAARAPPRSRRPAARHCRPRCAPARPPTRRAPAVPACSRRSSCHPGRDVGCALRRTCVAGTRVPRVLLAEQRAGNPFDPPPGGARHRAHAAVAADVKAEPARREPVAHHDRAERAEHRPGDHVARKMRRDDHPARARSPAHRPTAPDARAERPGRPPPGSRTRWWRGRTEGSHIPSATRTARTRTAPSSDGRTRPIIRLTIVSASPGSAMATNR